MDIREILTLAVEAEASDIILKPGVAASVKTGGRVVRLGDDLVTDAFNRELFEKVAHPRAKEKLKNQLEADLAWEEVGIGRFRANAFYQRGLLSMVLRRISTHVGSFGDLNLPKPAMEKLAAAGRGLVLVTGVAGSGKSTALAAMIEYINVHFPKHIVTIEDPIEYIFRDKKSVIQQRELSIDTETYTNALKHVVRQAPDVILIGEMRDRDTMEAALAAAETGHLVFSTLHTVNAIQTVERIISHFPAEQHGLIRTQLALLLQGVVSLRLIRRKDKEGSRIPAVEVMVGSPTTRELIEKGKTLDLGKAVEEGQYFGSQTFNQSLLSLLEKDLIDLDSALQAADNPDDLKLRVRGIRKGV